MRIRLTMNPGRSAETMTCLPSSPATSRTRASVASVVAVPRMSSMSGITGTGLKKCIPTNLPRRDSPTPAASVSMAMEDVFEELKVKHDVWRALDGQAPPEAIFASNTSSIAIHRLAEAVARERRARFVGMHVFSPVPVMPLVELIRAPATADDTVAAVRDLSVALGKQVIVSADKPGFIVNRILMPFLIEAMRALEQGVGTAEDIDTGARVGLNHPMGPLELADFIGLDVCLGIIRVLEDGLGQEELRAPRVLVELVAAGHLGQKTGQGFYTYPRG